MFTTFALKGSSLSLPLANKPKKAVVTKYTEERLMLKMSAHSGKVSLAKRAEPRDWAEASSGAEGFLRNLEVGPT